MLEQIANLNIQEDVLSLRIENKTLKEAINDLEAQIEKMSNVILELLYLSKKNIFFYIYFLILL